MAKSKKGAGGANYTTVDLGEKVDRALRSQMGASRPSGYRPASAGYRPGIFGGYRPGFSSGRWELGRKLNIPEAVQTKELVGGSLIGVVANRVLHRVTPQVLGTDKQLVVEGVNFVAGIIPFAFKQNAMTVGFALPGLFSLAGALVDMGVDYTGLARPSLQGPQIGSGRAAHAAQLLREASRRIDGARAAQRTPAFAGRVSNVA